MQILLSLLLCLCSCLGAAPPEVDNDYPVMLYGRIIDADTKDPLPAHVAIRGADGRALQSRFDFFPGFFTNLDGTFSISLDPGKYTIEATRGFDYKLVTKDVVVKPGQNPEVILALKPWVKMRDMGWVNGEAHSYMGSKKPWNADMIRTVHKIARAQGMDFVFANQGWAGYDEDRFSLAQSLGSDENFRLFFGATMPKQRFGHTWWLGLDNTCGYLHGSIDQGPHDYYRSNDSKFDPAAYPYTVIPSFEIVSRYKAAKNALAVHPHPTVWTWGTKHNPDAYMTAAMSSEIVFDLLSGQIWDGLVVMGYISDNYCYQNLWFNVLNLGYRMPPFTELDGGFGVNDPHYAGSLRTYYHIDGPLSVNALVEAGRKGHVFVTSGPLVFAKVDKKYEVGDIVPVNGQPHQMEIDAYASGEFDDHISFVIIFRNGKIFKIWDHRSEKPKHVHDVLDITEKDKAWYLVKVYGSHAWADLAQLDVMEVMKRAEKDKSVELPVKYSQNIAITSPFYFWPAGTEAPKVLISHVDLDLVDAKGNRIPEADVRVLLVGREIARYHVKGGHTSFDMPVNAWVEVKLPDGTVIRRTLFADYPPYMKILNHIITGDWTADNGPKTDKIESCVPWWAFQFDESKKVLSNPKWTIPVVPIERDKEWAIFDNLCGGKPFGVAAIPLPGNAKELTIKGKCVDADSRVALPACISIRDAKGEVVRNSYDHGPTFVTELDGTFSIDLAPGKYTLEITHGLDYEMAISELVVAEDKSYDLLVVLKPWVKVKEKGWFSGDVRTRLNSAKHSDADLVRMIHRVSRAQGLDFLVSAQNWAGYGENNFGEAQRLGSDKEFQLLFGAEMPQQRFGDSWWLGIDNTCNYLDQTDDEGYQEYEQSISGRITPDRFPFTGIPSVEFVPRFKVAKKAVAVHSHPSLWWWQHGKGEQYVTHVSAELVFGLLAGKLWDGIAIMGVDRDVFIHQNLWFHVLNQGYRMAPFCEVDTDLTKEYGSCVGGCRTYFYLDGLFSVPAMVEAARKGHTFVTSGPLVFATIDQKIQVGDIVSIDGKTHHLNIEAYASGTNKDFISSVVVWRNGKVYKVWDHRMDKPRKITHTLDINESEKSWFVVKVHGNSDLANPIDDEGVYAVSGSAPTLKHNPVAITSPFYFWPPGATDPPSLTSHVDLKIIAASGEPVREASVRVLLLGKELARYQASNGEVSFDMPVNAWVEISSEGETIRRSLFLDYLPYSKVLYHLISGDWTSDEAYKDSLIPGRVPWKAFSFEESKEVLQRVQWTVPMRPNDRDTAWKQFDELCGSKVISMADEPPPTPPPQNPTGRLQGSVTDADTKEPLPARIVLKDDKGEVLYSYYQHYPGFFTLVDGTFSVDLPPGQYTYEVTRGFDYNEATGKVVVGKGETDLTIALKPWVKLRERGWINGEAHAHINGKKSQDASMVRGVQQIARAQGMDFLYAVQGWAGYNEDKWAAAGKLGSDEKFSFLFGAEVPKQRFGHTWWLGIDNICHFYDHTMDKNYSKYYHSHSPVFTEEEFPLVQMPSMEFVPRFRQLKDAIAVHAHPTSWWTEGSSKHFITNIAADLVPDLLSGQMWDGLVVMGYDHDHYSYQNLWFYVLNMGYRVPPFAELDGGYPKTDPNYYGSMRTYFHINGPFSVPALVAAARAGHTFVTSGPIIFANVDHKYQVGDIVPLDGSKHQLDIEAHASGEFADYISYVVVFRNGQVHKVWDHRDEKPRQVTHTLDLDEKDKSWFVVKAYGSHTWDNPADLDVVAVTNRAIGDSTVKLPKHGSHDVAITSPFYLWPPGTTTPPALISHVQLEVVDSSGSPVPKADVKVLLLGKEIANYHLDNGEAKFDMPVNAWIAVTTPDGVTVHRSLFVDYEPYNKIVYSLISGAWRQHEGVRSDLPNGLVPNWAFDFDQAKMVLSEVSWKIVAVPNARDQEWPLLDTLCQQKA